MDDKKYIEALEERIRVLEEKLDNIEFSGESLNVNNCNFTNLKVGDSVGFEISDCTFVALNTGNTTGCDIYECQFESVAVGDSSSCEIHDCTIKQVKK